MPSSSSRTARRSRQARSPPLDHAPSPVDKRAGPDAGDATVLLDARARRSSKKDNAQNNASSTEDGPSPSSAEPSASPSPTGGNGEGSATPTSTATPEASTSSAGHSEPPVTTTSKSDTPVTTTSTQKHWVAPTNSHSSTVAPSPSFAAPSRVMTDVVTATLSNVAAASPSGSGASLSASSVTLVSSTAILTSTLAPTTISGVVVTPVRTSAVVTVVPSTVKPASTVKTTATGVLATQSADHNTNKLAAGAVAGIVIGCLLFLVAVYAFVAIWRRKREESGAYRDEYGDGYEGTSHDGMYEKTNHTTNLNRSGTTHSALSFSDDPVDRPPRSNAGWNQSYTGDGGFLSVPYGAPPLPPVQRAVQPQPQPEPIAVRSRDSAYSNNSDYSNIERHAYDGMSEDAHSAAPLQVRANDDIRLTQFDDWMQYENGLQPANPHSGSTEHIPAQAQVGLALSPPTSSAALAHHQAYDDIYDTYANEPRASNGPWLRSTPVPVPVSPVQLVQPHYGEVSHA